MTDTLVAANWLSHRVQRYHANPQLARIGQTNADHAHGVASIIGLLHPNPSASLLLAALWHDAGERYAGDLPQPFKVAYPDLAAGHSAAEEALALQCRPRVPLLAGEAVWLKFADRLEAILFASFHRPALLQRDDWQGFVEAMLQTATDLGVRGAVDEALAVMFNEGAF